MRVQELREEYEGGSWGGFDGSEAVPNVTGLVVRLMMKVQSWWLVCCDGMCAG